MIGPAELPGAVRVKVSVMQSPMAPSKTLEMNQSKLQTDFWIFLRATPLAVVD